MKTTTKRFALAAGLLVMSVAGMTAAYQVGGVAGKPTVIVTVDLSAVLEKLDLRGELDAHIRSMTDKLKVENEQRNADMSKAQAELKTLEDEHKSATDPAQKESLQKQMDAVQETAGLAMLNNQAWARFNTNRMDVEAALAYQDLYRSIKAAVAQMAGAAKYDIVLVDDSKGELATNSESRMSQEAQILQQIAGRRMLYANPAIDITDDLIVRMNNAHKTPATKPSP